MHVERTTHGEGKERKVDEDEREHCGSCSVIALGVQRRATCDDSVRNQLANG